MIQKVQFRQLSPALFAVILFFSAVVILSVSKAAIAADAETAAEETAREAGPRESRLSKIGVPPEFEEKAGQLADKLGRFSRDESFEKSWLGKTISLGVIFTVTFVLFLLLKLGMRKFEDIITEKEAIRESDTALRLKTLSRVVYWAATIFLTASALYMTLENFGINVAPLIAGAGIAGLAFGFGGQYLIRDIINGIFILVEGQYHVGDVIKVGEFGGLVENVNLRVTILRDLEGRVIYIPNGEIKSVINMTKEWSRALLNVGVAYKENVDRVMKVISEIGAEMRKDPYFGRLILEDLQMLGVDDFGDSQVSIRFFIKTLPIKQWEVAREFRRRLKNKFDELGIEIPFPHRTLYWGSGKDNEFIMKSPAAKG